LLLVLFGLYSYIVANWKKVLAWLKDRGWWQEVVQEEVTDKEFTASIDKEEEQKLHLNEQEWKISNSLAKVISFGFFHTGKTLSLVQIAWNVIFAVGLVVLSSYWMVEMAVRMARSLNISEVVIALTILAAGTGVPDLLASLKTAREGFGDTAIANAVGSNIFDILANLGLTWTVALLLAGTGSIGVNTDNLYASIVLLFASTIALFLVMVGKRFHLGKLVSALLMFAYVCYVTFEILKATGVLKI
jgi:Ca2+/Na+ antiporter